MVLSARVMVGVALLALAGGRIELALAQGNGPSAGESASSTAPSTSEGSGNGPSPNASASASANGSGEQSVPRSEGGETREGPQGGQGTGGPFDAPPTDAVSPQVEPPTNGRRPAQSDEDQALDAVQSGRAMPLDQIVGVVRQTTQGEIIDATLVTRNGKLFYEIKVLEESGQVTVLSYDALSGAPAS